MSTPPAPDIRPAGTPISAPPAEIDIQPFPGEPTLLELISKRQSKQKLYCVIPFFAIAVALGILCIIQPAHQGVTGRICTDLRQLVEVKTHQAQCNQAPSTWFPPTRDIYSVIASLILAAVPIAIYRQWSAYRRLLSSMVLRNAIIFSDDGTTLRNNVSIANRAIVTLGRRAPITLLISAGIVAELTAVQERRGVFYAFAPTTANRQSWSMLAYHSWWASPAQGYLGFGLYFTLASWSLYAVTQQNLVGAQIIKALWKSRNSIRFGADTLNSDGYFGWASVRSALVPTYAELTMHGVAIACVLVMMPPGSIVGPLALAAYQWMISLFVHLGFPFFFVKRNIANYKETEISSLEESARKAEQTLPEYERIEVQNAISRRMEMVRAIPDPTVQIY